MARTPKAQCEVCGHGTARIADSCWEAQQRMQRAEAQAAESARELAAMREGLKRADRWTEDARRELREARALLARAQREHDFAGVRAETWSDVRAFLDQRRDEVER